MKIRYISPLVMGVAAAAIALAPAASAEPTGFAQTCTDLGASNTQCQTPGNVQINDSPQVQYAPQYPFYGNLLIFHHGGHR
ncbi:hypothetical protein [Mycobacterium sp.]|uniref:hypothetical protein n=1 Tax=Mycobacterium sp. TaxID=1785 RepID=UPI002DAACEDB|nr:hypothetical protein [Mycobacterium sp.]